MGAPNPLEVGGGAAVGAAGGAALAALHLIALARKWSSTPSGIGFKPKGEDTLMAGEIDGNTTA